jgi:hypothetical protein
MAMVRKILWGVAVIAAGLVLTGAVLYFNAPLRNFALFAPLHGFDPGLAPPAPDYSTDAAWVALPERPGLAALVPPDSAAADAGPAAAVDVFFVAPTTYLDRAGWNARFDEAGGTETRLQNGVVRFQMSAFNGCCRIFAPRYRQATLYSFMGRGPSENAAIDFAYQDVLRAFDQFIAARNQGRPFILAGHSQGSLHGMRLLQERIAGTPLARRLVAAYLVGYAIPLDLKLAGGIGACRTPTDTGCYLTWNSVSPTANRAIWQQTSPIWLDQTYQPIAGRPLTCVNPLSGKLDDSAPAADNLGALGYTPNGAPLGVPLKQLTGAACTDGVLVVTPPGDVPGFSQGVFGGIYHLYDYNLFYMNVRQSLEVRTGAYLKALAATEPVGETRTP